MAKEPKNLDDLFHDTLKDIYFAEKKILATLPKMAKAAQNKELKAAFEKHYRETEGQVDRLEQVFATIQQQPTVRPAQRLSVLRRRERKSCTNIRVRLPSMQACSRRLRP